MRKGRCNLAGPDEKIAEPPESSESLINKCYGLIMPAHLPLATRKICLMHIFLRQCQLKILPESRIFTDAPPF